MSSQPRTPSKSVLHYLNRNKERGKRDKDRRAHARQKEQWSTVDLPPEKSGIVGEEHLNTGGNLQPKKIKDNLQMTWRKLTLHLFKLVTGRKSFRRQIMSLSITLSNLSPEYLKYYAMSHTQNSEQKTKLGALPDENSDTGLSETLETFAQSKDTIAPAQADG